MPQKFESLSLSLSFLHEMLGCASSKATLGLADGLVPCKKCWSCSGHERCERAASERKRAFGLSFCKPNLQSKRKCCFSPLSSYQPREELFWYRITKCLRRFPSVKKLQRDPTVQRLHSWRKEPSQSCSSYLTKSKALFFYFFFSFFFFTGTH